MIIWGPIMEEFSARQLFAVPSFDLEVEEQHIFDKFYHFLDNSGVLESSRRLTTRKFYEALRQASFSERKNDT